MSLLLLPFLATFVSCAALADVIYLKNGRKIVGRVTQEDSKKVTYSIQGGELSIPESLVDHIEKTANPRRNTLRMRVGRRKRGRVEIPLPSPPSGEPSTKTGSPVVKDGAIDEAYLLHLDNELTHHPSPENTRLFRQAYQQAGLFLARQGDPEGAIQKYQEALKISSQRFALDAGARPPSSDTESLFGSHGPAVARR